MKEVRRPGAPERVDVKQRNVSTMPSVVGNIIATVIRTQDTRNTPPSASQSATAPGLASPATQGTGPTPDIDAVGGILDMVGMGAMPGIKAGPSQAIRTQASTARATSRLRLIARAWAYRERSTMHHPPVVTSHERLASMGHAGENQRPVRCP
jgi:hypothetical protein